MTALEVISLIGHGKPLCIAKDGSYAKCIPNPRWFSNEQPTEIDINLANQVIKDYSRILRKAAKEDIGYQTGWESNGFLGNEYDVYRCIQ